MGEPGWRAVVYQLGKVRLGYLYSRLGEGQKARLFFNDSLLTFLKLEIDIGVLFTLEGYAALAVAEHQWEKAVQLISYAANQREQLVGARPPVEQASVERDLVTARSQLDDPAFEAVWAEGAALTQDQAIALAEAS
jgi:hypothetical protein